MNTRLILLGAAALVLTGCGRLGDLQQPPPLFGEAARAEYEASRRGAPDEASPAENERDDLGGPPTPGERVSPPLRSESGTRAAPVNIPPSPVAPQPTPPPPVTAPAPAPGTSGG